MTPVGFAMGIVGEVINNVNEKQQSKEFVGQPCIPDGVVARALKVLEIESLS